MPDESDKRVEKRHAMWKKAELPGRGYGRIKKPAPESTRVGLIIWNPILDHIAISSPNPCEKAEGSHAEEGEG
jgi:hypothetical protein